MKFVYCIIITIAMIAMTTRSSIKVKKVLFCLMAPLRLYWGSAYIILNNRSWNNMVLVWIWHLNHQKIHFYFNSCWKYPECGGIVPETGRAAAWNGHRAARFIPFRVSTPSKRAEWPKAGISAGRTCFRSGRSLRSGSFFWRAISFRIPARR